MSAAGRRPQAVPMRQNGADVTEVRWTGQGAQRQPSRLRGPVPLFTLVHCTRWCSLFLLVQAVNFVYVHAAGLGIHYGVHCHTMTDQGLHRVLIVNGIDFLGMLINEHSMLSRVQTFLSACFMSRSSSLDPAFRVAYPTLLPLGFGGL